MGWICYDEAPIDIKAEITRLCTHASDTQSIHPLYIQQVGTTWYAAVEAWHADSSTITDYTVDQFGRYVFAAVFLTSNEGCGWGYKDMGETCGPCMATASPKLINMLSDTTSDYANEWRAKCLEQAVKQNRKLKHGDCIQFKTPLSFGDDIERSMFKVSIVKYPGQKRSRTLFECIDTSVLCNIRGYKTMNWRIVIAATKAPSRRKVPRICMI